MNKLKNHGCCDSVNFSMTIFLTILVIFSFFISIILLLNFYSFAKRLDKFELLMQIILVFHLETLTEFLQLMQGDSGTTPDYNQSPEIISMTFDPEFLQQQNISC